MSDEPRPWRIREATRDDLPFMAEMALPFDPPANPRAVVDWGRPGDFALVAEVGGRPVGAAWYREEPDYMHGPIRPQNREVFMGIVEAERGRGLANHLMERLIEHARQGPPRLDALVAIISPKNPDYGRAVALCRRFQFEEPPSDNGRWLLLLV
ncbi:MAG: GNAT family N-acetyltransferase [Actinomycetota bacterium]|nr:GNAT family N-acetyltransferase [Actinomycetota bacterium]